MTTTARPSRRTVHLLLLGLVLAAALALLVALCVRFASVARVYIDDYIAYWAAGRLNATGHDPYGEASLRALQATLSPADPKYGPFHYTPWALALIMPFGLLDYGPSRALWTVLSLLGFAALCRGLWLLCGGSRKRAALGLALGLTFVPSLISLGIGQISWLVLASAAGFLYFAERSEARWRWLAAGACVALAGVKPQLLYLFWPAVLFWIIEHRRWPVLLGGVATGLAGTGIALACNPAVLGQYFSVDYSPFLLIPTPSAALRLLLAPQATWLQTLPAACGALWFLFYWRGHHRNWRWEEQLPLLVLVSLATAPVVWVYDYVLLLLPITRIAARLGSAGGAGRGKVIVAAYALIDVLILASAYVVHTKHLGYIWAPPALLVWYLVARQRPLPLQGTYPQPVREKGEALCAE